MIFKFQSNGPDRKIDAAGYMPAVMGVRIRTGGYRTSPNVIGAWRAKREIVSFRVVHACARCLCEVGSG